MLRTAFVSTYAPHRCGIAIFTSDLAAIGEIESAEIAALHPQNGPEHYPPEVRHRIRREVLADYLAVAGALNDSGVEVVSIQHEYGIWGGDDGAYVLDFVRALRLPFVVTLHTVLRQPSRSQRRILTELVGYSAATVVMSRAAAVLLGQAYGIEPSRLRVIPHGVPSLSLVDPETVKPRLGLEGQAVILSFGLLGPGKGYELAIAAMPAIVAAVPSACYVILGATHPNLLATEGEAYREQLEALAAALGVSERVRFVNRFVDQAELGTWLQAADIFVTPYPDPGQIVSGTLSYAMSAGKAIVSTPYSYAREQLAHGRGRLVSATPEALAEGLTALLREPETRAALGARAYWESERMRWPRVGVEYRRVFDQAIASPATPAALARSPRRRIAERPLYPVNREHLEALTGPLGIWQHAQGIVPDPSLGYCVDDVSRALLVDLLHRHQLGWVTVRDSARRSLRFLEAAFDPESRRFRNFRDDTGRWLEDGEVAGRLSCGNGKAATGSQDSQGRALLALGRLLVEAPEEAAIVSARSLFRQALPAARELTSPRACALALLAADAAQASGERGETTAIFEILAGRLARAFATTADPEWPWPEAVLTYENGLLPQALLAAGRRLEDEGLSQTGLRVLDWLVRVQTSAAGWLTPIGNAGWWPRGGVRSHFDQQPVEAAGLLLAAEAAFYETRESRYRQTVELAYGWFLGDNELSLPLADPRRGGCHDGLTPGGVNRNEGAESTLMWLTALEHIRRLRARSRPGAVRTDGERG
jgi:glycosyltransferase involved in cell wall biosynthesis